MYTQVWMSGNARLSPSSSVRITEHFRGRLDEYFALHYQSPSLHSLGLHDASHTQLFPWKKAARPLSHSNGGHCAENGFLGNQCSKVSINLSVPVRTSAEKITHSPPPHLCQVQNGSLVLPQKVLYTVCPFSLCKVSQIQAILRISC